jgi:hypothetical protein
MRLADQAGFAIGTEIASGAVVITARAKAGG